MNITVYLGANAGNDPALAEAVRELGSWIGANGHRLVYGGSRSGLMGQLAQSALDAGGTVTGVEPQFFVQQELQHDGLTELIVTKDMTCLLYTSFTGGVVTDNCICKIWAYPLRDSRRCYYSLRPLL